MQKEQCSCSRMCVCVSCLVIRCVRVKPCIMSPFKSLSLSQIPHCCCEYPHIFATGSLATIDLPFLYHTFIRTVRCSEADAQRLQLPWEFDETSTKPVWQHSVAFFTCEVSK